MKDGLYRHIDDYVLNTGEIIIKLKETEKSYVFELIKNNLRYSNGHIDMMFSNSNKIRINKKKSPHKINISGDDWFCIYPYRAGVPYVFEFLNESKEMAGDKE